MKEMDYVVMGTVAQRIITARSARAKLRTPEPLMFDNNDAALEFVRSSNQKGFRFSGQDLIDRAYRLVKYVYFVRPVGGGRFQPAGQDFGPPESVFEPGDIHTGGARDGKVAVVLRLVKGQAANTNGGDVMMLMEERLANRVGPPPGIPPEIYWDAMGRFAEDQKQEEDRVARFGEVRRTVSFEHQGHRFVAVGGTLHHSKNWKFFPDFLRDYVPAVFGREWYEEQRRLEERELHPVMHWRTQALRFMVAQPSDAAGISSAIPNGSMAAYLRFAYDLYCVGDNGGLDDLLLQRLKHRDQFQGARHELFAEATCLRAGYEVVEREDERDRSRRHAEFTVRHRRTGQMLSVEAKSKHSPGVLGRSGEVPEKFDLRFGHLINDALAKNPLHPLAVFIDTNLPTRAAERLYPPFNQRPMPTRVMEALLDRVRREHNGRDPYTLLVFTNHPHHYGSPDEIDPMGHLFTVMPSGVLPGVQHPASVAEIHRASNMYRNIPNDFP